MRAVVQRVSKARVDIEGETTGEIAQGFVVLLGITHNDTEEDAEALAQKIIHLRVFEDEAGKMNRSLVDLGGNILSISQFTLYGDVRKGRRPNFMQAAKPGQAKKLYEFFNKHLQELGIHVETGVFGAMMDVSLVNDGPVTITIESENGKIIS